MEHFFHIFTPGMPENLALVMTIQTYSGQINLWWFQVKKYIPTL